MIFFHGLNGTKPKISVEKTGIGEIFYPHTPLQDKSQSIVDSRNRYDLTRFSAHEASVIFDVLRTIDEAYPPQYRGMGLVNESYCVVYKPRYVLFHIVILRHAKSRKPIDQLAVAMAYQSKGYYFRKQAIKHFEKAECRSLIGDMERFNSYGPLIVYNLMSELYEWDGQFSKAYKYATLASKYSTPNNQHFVFRMQDLKGKMNNPPGPYERNISKRQQEFEDKVDAAAREFLRRYGS